MDQSDSPSRFNFSSSFSCLTSTDMGSCQASVSKETSISNDNLMGNTSYAATCITGTPFLRKMWLSDTFLTMSETLPLPFLRQVNAWRTLSTRGSGLTSHGGPSPALSGVIITWAISPKRDLTLPSMISVWNCPK